MNTAEAKTGPRTTQMSPKQVLEELAELLRDLHELLESYGPLWYKQEMDHRIVQMLGQVNLPSRSPQTHRGAASAQRLE